MATFISISGPSSTGKTSLVDSLSMYHELSNAIICPDIYNVVWDDLVRKGLFVTYKEVSMDYEYLCVYILKLLEYYQSCIDRYKDTDKLVILDGSWIDISIFSVINMWYNSIIKEVQENILLRVNSIEDHLSRVYITRFDESKQDTKKYHKECRSINAKLNRKLEFQYYKLAENFSNAIGLPSSDIVNSSLFIIEDLKNLGYVR